MIYDVTTVYFGDTAISARIQIHFLLQYSFNHTRYTLYFSDFSFSFIKLPLLHFTVIQCRLSYRNQSYYLVECNKRVEISKVS